MGDYMVPYFELLAHLCFICVLGASDTTFICTFHIRVCPNYHASGLVATDGEIRRS